MQCLLVFDRHDDVSCLMEEVGQKGTVKLGQVPLAGLHEQSGLKCTGLWPSPQGRATGGCMASQRICHGYPELGITMIIPSPGLCRAYVAAFPPRRVFREDGSDR